MIITNSFHQILATGQDGITQSNMSAVVGQISTIYCKFIANCVIWSFRSLQWRGVLTKRYPENAFSSRVSMLLVRHWQFWCLANWMERVLITGLPCWDTFCSPFMENVTWISPLSCLFTHTAKPLHNCDIASVHGDLGQTKDGLSYVNLHNSQ